MKEQKTIIDLGAARKEQLNESWLAMFGGWVEWLIKGLDMGSFKVTGTETEIGSFLDTIASERRYLDAASRYGLTDPRTFENRVNLETAIKGFERETGIKWPIK